MARLQRTGRSVSFAAQPDPSVESRDLALDGWLKIEMSTQPLVSSRGVSREIPRGDRVALRVWVVWVAWRW